jgi:hypothetical protein
VNAQLLPGFLWHWLQAPELWLAGRLWHEAQFAEELGCEKAQLRPTFLWQVVHAAVL